MQDPIVINGLTTPGGTLLRSVAENAAAALSDTRSTVAPLMERRWLARPNRRPAAFRIPVPDEVGMGFGQAAWERRRWSSNY